MPDYPPYVNGYGGIPKLFAEIRSASVPPKFTQDFMNVALGLKSSSYRAMIPLLKKLGFIDQANVPTQAYRDFREDALSGPVMAQRLREAYAPLFAANEYAWRLDRKELHAKLKNITGAGDDDANLVAVVGTFIELSKLARWEGMSETRRAESLPSAGIAGNPINVGSSHSAPVSGMRIGLSYTINLNLPATTEIDVFNAIFKSLRENLLVDQ